MWIQADIDAWTWKTIRAQRYVVGGKKITIQQAWTCQNGKS